MENNTLEEGTLDPGWHSGIWIKACIHAKYQMGVHHSTDWVARKVVRIIRNIVGDEVEFKADTTALVFQRSRKTYAVNPCIYIYI